MNLVLFDDLNRNQLLPFTHTRPIADIRCGIMTLRERWEFVLQKESGTLTVDYLQAAFPQKHAKQILYVNGSVIANSDLIAAIQKLDYEQVIMHEDQVIAIAVQENIANYSDLKEYALSAEKIYFDESIIFIHKPWHIFEKNEMAINLDFETLTNRRTSQEIPESVIAINPENIFIEEGAVLNPCILNASKGYIYIAKDAEIMEGCMVRGPLSLGEHATLKMGAKVYGATTIGPDCKVGGEVGNVVFFNHSNKGHDGFLGNSVVGDWCNFGADTNCSNLKNNYSEVSVWNEFENESEATGLQFCGLLMGDHSKCGINTMFNTGTIVGVSCNIYGGSFPDKFIPSFSWGGSDGFTEYQIEKAIDTANKMMERRGMSLTEEEIAIFQYISKKNQLI